MKRIGGGERDLDHIILAVTRGDHCATLRSARPRWPHPDDGPHSTEREHTIIVEKALHWAPRGIVGIDIAGPRLVGQRYDYPQAAPMVQEARQGGLGG